VYWIKILEKDKLCDNVYRFKFSKPQGFKYNVGQAVSLGFENSLKPFTFTSLPTDDYLEFMIKVYPERNGITFKLAGMRTGEILMGEPFGDLQFKGDGLFICAGSGITPFIPMFKSGGKGKLLWWNSTENEVFMKDWLKENLDCEFFLTQERKERFGFGRVSKEVLAKENFDKIYVCGLSGFVNAVSDILKVLGRKCEIFVW